MLCPTLVAVTTPYLRSLLRRLYRTAENEAATLADTLAAFEDARIDATKDGDRIVSTSSAGKSISFGNAGNMTPKDLAEAADRLVTLYETVVDTLDITEDHSNVATIRAAMLKRLQTSPKAATIRFTAFRSAR